MPNHVTNKLTFSGDQKLIDKMLGEIQNDEEGIGSIDFNKIIPMPESLNIESGSQENYSINAYLTAINPTTDDLGIPKMTDAKAFNELYTKLNAQKMFSSYNKTMSLEEIEKYKCPDESIEDFLNLGKKYVDNFINHGATSWYDWAIAKRGSKWLAYNTQPQEGNTLTYDTAWSNVMPVIGKLSTMYPELEINYKWADEDVGVNVGEVDLKNGEIVFEHIPDAQSKEAYEMAEEIIGYDLASWGLAFNEKSGGYEYSEETQAEYENTHDFTPQMN